MFAYSTAKDHLVEGARRIVVCAMLTLSSGLGADDVGIEQATTEESLGIVIDEAEQALARAAALGNVWLDTRNSLAGARRAREAGNLAIASELARAARRQAELAVNQAQLEHARYYFNSLPTDTDPLARQALLTLLRGHDGAAALQFVQDLMPSFTRPASARRESVSP